MTTLASAMDSVDGARVGTTGVDTGTEEGARLGSLLGIKVGGAAGRLAVGTLGEFVISDGF